MQRPLPFEYPDLDYGCVDWYPYEAGAVAGECAATDFALPPIVSKGS